MQLLVCIPLLQRRRHLIGNLGETGKFCLFILSTTTLAVGQSSNLWSMLNLKGWPSSQIEIFIGCGLIHSIYPHFSNRRYRQTSAVCCYPDKGCYKDVGKRYLGLMRIYIHSSTTYAILYCSSLVLTVIYCYNVTQRH